MSKQALRRSVLSQRGALSEQARINKSQAICSAIIEQLDTPAWRERFEQGVLAAYLPFGHEAHLDPLIEWCWLRKIRVAVPRTQPDKRELHFHLLTSFAQTVPGVWGIREPKPEAEPLADLSELVCMLVPGVAFDGKKGRLGYGGGYYDRFAERLLAANVQPFKLAAAFDLQIVSEVPMDAHDLRVDRIVTESRVID